MWVRQWGVGERKQEKQRDSQFVQGGWEQKLNTCKPACGEGGEKEEGAENGEEQARIEKRNR